MRGVTNLNAGHMEKTQISTHTPRERRDKNRQEKQLKSIEFQLTRLVRGVTFFKNILNRGEFISTHTPRERRDTAEMKPRSKN